MNRTVRIILIIVLAVAAVFLVVRFWDDIERFFSNIGRRIKKLCPSSYAEECGYDCDFDSVSE